MTHITVDQVVAALLKLAEPGPQTFNSE